LRIARGKWRSKKKEGGKGIGGRSYRQKQKRGRGGEMPNVFRSREKDPPSPFNDGKLPESRKGNTEGKGLPPMNMTKDNL